MSDSGTFNRQAPLQGKKGKTCRSNCPVSSHKLGSPLLSGNTPDDSRD
jgi:hypothetical protein